MKKPDAALAFQVAWAVMGWLPAPVARGLFNVVADVAWLLRGGGVRQMERNYARVSPGLRERELRTLSRVGMRSYMRYYCEVFTMRTWSKEQINARTRAIGTENITGPRDAGDSMLAVLAHQANWDLAGAWVGSQMIPVVTVAERLNPPKLYEEFLAFRQDLGITVHTLGDPGVFRELARAAKAGGSLIPLLADRDLSRNGIEVDFCGHRARVAAGPAVLAVTTGAPLLPITLAYERLEGERRRRAKSPWGLVITFHEAVVIDRELPRREQIVAVTQSWVDVLSADIAREPHHWHMLQKVFIDDLDPERYARTRATDSHAADTRAADTRAADNHAADNHAAAPAPSSAPSASPAPPASPTPAFDAKSASHPAPAAAQAQSDADPTFPPQQQTFDPGSLS